MECCPLCVQALPRKINTAGHQPIVTKGFGARGQVRHVLHVSHMNSFIGRSEPMLDCSEPVLGGSEPVLGGTEPVLDDSKPVPDCTHPLCA